METVIITRHSALVDYIFEKGIAPKGTKVIPHANKADVLARRVIGVLPLYLAALADSVVNIPFNIPPELRGAELTLEQVREFAQPVEEYVTRRI